jgi:hypothetical protein
VLSELGAVLAIVAVVAGVTGTWSPCGLSMIETIGPHGHEGGRRTTLAACGAFGLGALAGGVLTFGSLSLLGAAVGVRGEGLAGGAAVVVAAAAALGDARGARILPQVRRQVPEPWRRSMPVPLAAGLYGGLLGLGFTTFVLTFAVWALAGIAVALGDLEAGVVMGLAFGAGRALPVLALAPLAEGERGARLTELMAERPRILRGARFANAAALAAFALLLGTGTASAARRVASSAADPSVANGGLAFQRPGGNGMLQVGRIFGALSGHNPSLAGYLVAWREGELVRIADRRNFFVVLLQRRIPGLQKIAISGRWLAYRRRVRGADVLQARPLFSRGLVRTIARARGSLNLGRPAIYSDTVVFHLAGRSGSRLLAYNVRRRRLRVVRQSRNAQLLHPSVLGDRILYVAIGRCSQELRLGYLRTARRERVLMRLGSTSLRDRGHSRGHTGQGSEPGRCPRRSPPRTTTVLWSTALSQRRAYVTQLRPRRDGSTAPSIFSVGRG